LFLELLAGDQVLFEECCEILELFGDRRHLVDAPQLVLFLDLLEAYHVISMQYLLRTPLGAFAHDGGRETSVEAAS